jgi:hypothetical protein
MGPVKRKTRNFRLYWAVGAPWRVLAGVVLRNAIPFLRGRILVWEIQKYGNLCARCTCRKDSCPDKTLVRCSWAS